jgi:hypothetical protein
VEAQTSILKLLTKAEKVRKLQHLLPIFSSHKLLISHSHDNKNVLLMNPVFDVDDEYIPKNSSLVVRRMPAKSAATSLIAKLKGNARGGPTAATLVTF